MSTPGDRWRRLAWSRSKMALMANYYSFTTKGDKVVNPYLFKIRNQDWYTPPTEDVAMVYFPSRTTFSISTPADKKFDKYYIREYDHSKDGVYNVLTHWGRNHIECCSPWDSDILEYVSPDTRIASFYAGVDVEYVEKRISDGFIIGRGAIYIGGAKRFIIKIRENNGSYISFVESSGVSLSGEVCIKIDAVNSEPYLIPVNDEDFEIGIDVPIIK